MSIRRMLTHPAVLVAVLAAFASASTALADDDLGPGDVISTTCGAGTMEACGSSPIESCDWDFNFSLNPMSNSFGLHLSRTNCRTTGYLPVYKNNPRTHYSLSGSCN